MSTPRKPTPLKHCASCGKKMERKTMNGRLEDLATFRRRQYCDRRCMARGQEKERCASLSHSRIKASRTMKAACEACGRSEKRLHVHHIDHDPRNNAPSNLKTLCASCHRRSHSPSYIGTLERKAPCAHCSKPSVKIGLCNTHLTRFRRYGDPSMRKVKIGSEWRLQRVTS